MIWIYGSLTLILLICILAKRKYRSSFFEGIEKKEHPLRLLYGCSLWFYEFYRKVIPAKAQSKTDTMIKSLCVKENVSREITLYYVKKISFGLCVLLGSLLAGFCYCAANGRAEAVTSLLRGEYGSGSTSYSLNVNYDGREETVELEIEERLYTDEEISKLFEQAYEAVGELMLADNESAQSVSSSLDLVSSYGEIDIYWETEDTDILDYNGELGTELQEGESLTVNLYATFSLEDMTAIYTYPVTLVGEMPGETELLLSYIMEEIEENNSIYESEVSLPENINGESISFSEISENRGYLFLILGIAAFIAAGVLYDRKLEDKMKERRDQLMCDLAEIVSKLNLLYAAGLSIYRAWERMVADHESKQEKEKHFAYSEMKLALEKIKSGIPEQQAYEEFGRRCGLHPYIKLGNLLSQNLSKGSKGLSVFLDQEAQTAFEERKRIARKKGEEAGTKMLFPMILLLVVVIVIVAVPALMSISF